MERATEESWTEWLAGSGYESMAERREPLMRFTVVPLSSIALMAMGMSMFSLTPDSHSMLHNVPWSVATGSDGHYDLTIYSGINAMLQEMEKADNSTVVTRTASQDNRSKTHYIHAQNAAGDELSVLHYSSFEDFAGQDGIVAKTTAWEDKDCPDEDLCDSCAKSAPGITRGVLGGLVLSAISLYASFGRAEADSKNTKLMAATSALLSCCAMLFALLSFAQDCYLNGLDTPFNMVLERRLGSGWMLTALACLCKAVVFVIHVLTPSLEFVGRGDLARDLLTQAQVLPAPLGGARAARKFAAPAHAAVMRRQAPGARTVRPIEAFHDYMARGGAVPRRMVSMFAGDAWDNPMAKVGDAVPSVNFLCRVRDESIGGDNPFDWRTVPSDSMFKGKRVVLFSLPGAFTPTCSSFQLPGYINSYEEMKSLGVDEVYCLSVNDGFVMRQWGLSQGLEEDKTDTTHPMNPGNFTKVKLIPDGAALFTRGMGMSAVWTTNRGFGERSWRYSCVINDGKVEKIFVEGGGVVQDSDPDPYEVTDEKTMLDYLKSC